jgi:hypothetical protein
MLHAEKRTGVWSTVANESFQEDAVPEGSVEL